MMYWRALCLMTLAVLCACSITGEPPCPYTGEADYGPSAGCLAVVHGKVLVVGSRNGGVTPPGGSTRSGESAQCTAHRETWEETGLDLLPRQLLKVFDTGFHLYHCEIHAGSGEIRPAFFEVGNGYWLPIERFGETRWRYPGQGEDLYQVLFPGEQ